MTRLGLGSCTLQKHNTRERRYKDQNWEEFQYTGRRGKNRLVRACGGKLQVLLQDRRGTTREGRKGSKSNGRRNSLAADALKHSCYEGESPYNYSSPLNLNSFPLSLHRVNVERAGLGISFPSRAAAGGWVGMSRRQ